MDLTYDALNKNIDTELKPIYLLYGSEQYLIENTVNRIKKKFGEKVLGINLIKEGLKCLLRSEILHIYYKNREQKTIRQYEYENFTFCYKAYKSLKGNSFVDHIHEEVKEWEVIS